MKLVILGAGPAGLSAAQEVLHRRAHDDGRTHLVLLSAEESVPVSLPLLPELLTGEIDEERLAFRGSFPEGEGGVTVGRGRPAVRLRVDEQEVELADGESVTYDRLLIATGARPAMPPVPGLTGELAHTLNSPGDVRRLQRSIRSARSAIVLGAGLIGLKAAAALHQLGLAVTVIEILPQVLSSVLDARGASIMEEHLARLGITALTDTRVGEVGTGAGGKGVAVITAQGDRLEGDFLVCATGVSPNISFLEDSAPRCARGVLVDQYLESSVPGVFGAGDVVEFTDRLYGAVRVNANWVNAVEQGRVAGRNLLGDREEYPGSMALNSLRIMGLPLITMGVIEAEGPEVEEFSFLCERRPSYRKIVLRSGRIVGAAFVNDIEGAGLVCGLLRGGVDVSAVKNDILKEKAPFIRFLTQLNREELLGSVAWPRSLGMTEEYRKKIDDEAWRRRQERPHESST